jgi:autotransporter-associated beta strand protein
MGGTGPTGSGALFHQGGGGGTIFGGPITLSDNALIVLDNYATLDITNAGGITGSNLNLTIQGNGTGAALSVGVVSGPISLGNGSLTQNGGGTWTLISTNNNWTGGTVVNSGTLQIGDGGNDGSIGNGPITVNGTLIFNSSSSNFVVNPPISDYGTLTFNGSANFIVNSQISGSGALNDTSSGLVTLAANNSYYGGAVKISGTGLLLPLNNSALGTGTVTIGGAQADTCSLDLTGGIDITNDIAIFPRAFTGTITATTPTTNYPNIVNLSGTNTVNVPAPVTVASGGNLFTLQCNSGYLIFDGGVTAAGSGRFFALQGGGSGEVDGPITQNSGYSVNVYLVGSGLWYLNGQSSYTGVTVVSNGTLVVNGSIASSPVTAYGGTLGGIGALTGPVVVATGARLAPTLATGPATPIGTLTVNNTLTLQPGSITSLQISAVAGTNDQIAGLTSVSYGGTLRVTNIGGTLAAGNSFTLFSASSYSNAFSSYVLPPLGPGLAWSVGGLAVNGTLSVATLTRPTFAPAFLSGTNLTLSGSGGAPGVSYSVLTSTNLAAPLTAWAVVNTGNFDVNGNFNVTNGISAGTQRFYMLRSP